MSLKLGRRQFVNGWLALNGVGGYDNPQGAQGGELLTTPIAHGGGDASTAMIWLVIAIVLLLIILFLADGHERKYRKAVRRKLECLKK